MNTGIVILKYKYNSYILYSQFSLSLFSSYNIYIYIFFLIYYNFKCVFMLKKASFYRKRKKIGQIRRKKSSNICTHVN